MNSISGSSTEQELVKVFEAAGVVEYLEYLQSGKRIMWVNFKAGVAKGFGITVGMTVVLGAFAWVLTLLVDLPVVGEYFEEATQEISEYAEKTNYTDEFADMTQVLHEINENLKIENQQAAKLEN